MKTEPAIAIGNAGDEISALVSQLIATEQRLLELTQGQMEVVLDPGGRSYLLRQAQEKLRESEAGQRQFADTQLAILNALPANIALIDNAGVILSVNQGWRRFATANVLQDAGSKVGQNYLAACDQAAGSKIREARQIAAGIRAVLAGASAQFELEYPCHSPIQQKWFRLLVTPLKRAGLTGAVVMHLDVTERKKAEDSAIRMAAIVECSNDAIVSTDLKGIATHWNKGAENLYGYKAHEMVGSSIMCLIPPERQGEERQILDRLQRDEIVQNFETLRVDKAGKLINVSVTASPIKDADGQLTGVSKVVRDITEQRKLEEQFRQSQKMEAIGQLAGGVAHDFNNILSVIQMQVGLLKVDGDLSPAHLVLANDIEKSCQRAADLTRQLLMFGRRQAMQARDLDLNTVVETMTKMLRRILGEDIEIHFKYAPQPLSIHADAGMMDQILLNLTVNSRDAMPKGGQLVIETSAVKFSEAAAAKSPPARAGSFVCLSVSDTGAGIPPEAMPRIFEPFFTTKDIGKGTGLGLATVFGIVQQHQGWITVQSEVDKGTIFKIYLPQSQRMAAPPAPRPLMRPLLGGTETILLVEDDASLRAAMQRTLAQLGYRIIEAQTGQGALETWKKNQAEIDLLLTDIVMPDGVSGRELAEQLLNDKPELKVIYISGYSTTVGSEDFPLIEGVNFLTKPFATQKLAQTVRDCLNLKQD